MKNKQEQKFTTKFRLWAKRRFPTCAIEVKHTRGLDYFDCREFKEHQYWSLMAAASGSGLAYKIPDDGIGAKPFDLILLRNVPAYVVVKFKKQAFSIPIEKWSLSWKRLTPEMAKYIGTEIIL